MNTSINESNSWGADLHIPIHTNAGGGSGTVVFVYSTTQNNLNKAKPIYDAVQAVTPGKTEYGVRSYAELAELNATSAIAVYIEVDFHDNYSIAKWLVENTDKVGEAICRGVCKAFNVKYIEPSGQNKKYIYRVQIGAYTNKANAEKTLEQAKKAGFSNAFIVTVDVT